MAGDVRLTRLLLGLGLREFSMHATQLPEIKQRILHTDIQTATPLAQQMLLTSDPQQLHQLLEQINH
jgi:phosphotransferase system enzyme I (PtsI)